MLLPHSFPQTLAILCLQNKTQKNTVIDTPAGNSHQGFWAKVTSGIPLSFTQPQKPTSKNDFQNISA